MGHFAEVCAILPKVRGVTATEANSKKESAEKSRFLFAQALHKSHRFLCSQQCGVNSHSGARLQLGIYSRGRESIFEPRKVKLLNFPTYYCPPGIILGSV
jgi:hypothetical protein